MGYMLDIDEMTEESLESELTLRLKRRAEGKCDYCNRPPTEPSCKFPKRHFVSMPDVGTVIAMMRKELDDRLAYSGDPSPDATRELGKWVPMLQAAWAKTPVLTK